MLKEYEAIRLLVDLPEHGLLKGMLGTVVLIHSRPSLAYEVEFMSAEGETLALLPEQIEPA